MNPRNRLILQLSFVSVPVGLLVGWTVSSMQFSKKVFFPRLMAPLTSKSSTGKKSKKDCSKKRFKKDWKRKRPNRGQSNNLFGRRF